MRALAALLAIERRWAASAASAGVRGASTSTCSPGTRRRAPAGVPRGGRGRRPDAAAPARCRASLRARAVGGGGPGWRHPGTGRPHRGCRRSRRAGPAWPACDPLARAGGGRGGRRGRPGGPAARGGDPMPGRLRRARPRHRRSAPVGRAAEADGRVRARLGRAPARPSSRAGAAVRDDDLVLVPGDISWAMRLEEARSTCGDRRAARDQGPAARQPRLLVAVARRLRSVLPPRMHVVQNDAVRVGDVVVGGTRGWLCPGSPGFGDHDRRIYEREVHAADAVAAGDGAARRRLPGRHAPLPADQPARRAVGLHRGAARRAPRRAGVRPRPRRRAVAVPDLPGTRVAFVAADRVGFEPVRAARRRIARARPTPLGRLAGRAPASRAAQGCAMVHRRQRRRDPWRC
jgi:predicted phosphohydrolase